MNNKSELKSDAAKLEQVKFLMPLGLTTSQKFQEIQVRMKERKRRHNVSPRLFLLLEQEKLDENGDPAEVVPSKKKRGRPPKQLCKQSPVSNVVTNPTEKNCQPDTSSDLHHASCSVCSETGELLMCDACPRVYHLTCTSPPLQVVPHGAWFCPFCKEKMEDARLPDVSEVVRSTELYETYWQERDNEKNEHLRVASDLRQRKQQLEKKAKLLSQTISNHIQMKKDTMRNITVLQESVSKMEQFIDVIRQLAHVIDTDQPHAAT